MPELSDVTVYVHGRYSPTPGGAEGRAALSDVTVYVHGRYRQPCPARGAPVRRIVYAESETNY